MTSLQQYINENIFNNTGVGPVMEFGIEFDATMPKRFDVKEWTAFWAAIRDNFLLVTGAMEKGQIEKNLKLLNIIKIMLVDPKYYPFESKPSYEIRLLKNEKKFGSEEWTKKLESYSQDIRNDRLFRLWLVTAGCLWHDVFVPMGRVLNIDNEPLQNQYYTKISKLIKDCLKSLQ